jgi:hypothetical protein
MDVGIKIFTGLNISRGLAVPVLVHFHYSSRVPGSRERTVARCRRVKAAIEARYRHLHEQGLLHCQMAVSDREDSERCTFIEDLARKRDTEKVESSDQVYEGGFMRIMKVEKTLVSTNRIDTFGHRPLLVVQEKAGGAQCRGRCCGMYPRRLGDLRRFVGSS